ADGRARVQALPVADARNSEGLHRFVDEVRRIVPEAGGPAVAVVSPGDTIVQALKAAAPPALGGISLTLVASLARAVDGASMGALLLISVVCSLLATLLFVRALLTALSPPHVREARVAAARTPVAQRAR